ncbi:MAG TPA: hypothetical protein VK766_05270 [Cytophagaceae bacterium]|jgi:hypothetical protein|nr:hypothetical protein [Cytophagaceae bacterium]
MIHYIKHDTINRTKWDALIERAVNKNFYAYTWYLDLVCEGWDALVEDDYCSVMPVTKGQKFFLKYVYQPMFAQQLGVFSEREITQDKVSQFLAILSKKYKYIEMNLNYENTFSVEGFHQTQMINYEVPLNNSYEELRKKYKLDTRWQVKKSLLNNLTIEKTKDTLLTIKMFQKNKGHIYTNIKQKNYNTLQRLVEGLLLLGKAEVWHVKDEKGTVLVGAFFFMFENRIIFSFSGRTEEARDKKAMYFLCTKVIEEHSSKNIIFDFAGSNDPGVGNFYRSFGAQERKYLRIKKNELPFFVKWLKK